jgi:hypothetical protein
MPLFRQPWPTPPKEAPHDPDHRRASQLLNAAMTYGRLILRRYGQLPPFAFSMDREGQIARETLEIPRLPRDPERLLRLLTDHIADRVRRGQIQAVAIAANVALSAPSPENYTDAVILTIEQESGHALEVTIPYKIYGGQFHNLLPRRIAFGQLVSEDKDSHLFAHPR